MAFSKINLDVPALQKVTDALKSWIMLFLTIAFVILYALALSGRIKPLPDTSLVARLEPIIFVIIGYYFGRIPGQQNENTLKTEIARQRLMTCSEPNDDFSITPASVSPSTYCMTINIRPSHS